MKKKLLLTSILSIVMCFSLIVGSTFALFTSESTVNVAVTSGKVKVTASVEKWQYTTLTKGEDVWVDANLTDTVLFDNIGGKATITNGATVKLDKIVPGDGVKLSVKIVNESNVTVKYRVVIKNSADSNAALFNALDVKVNDTAYSGIMATDWAVLAGVNTATDVVNIPVEIVLPAEAKGDAIMEKACEITLTVEAIQGNAETVNDLKVDSETALAAALAKGGNVVLDGDITLTESVVIPAGVTTTLDLNGNNIITSSATTASTFSATTYAASINAIKNNGTLTIVGDVNSKISGENAYAIVNNGDLLIDGVYVDGGINSNKGSVTINDGKVVTTRGGYSHAVRHVGSGKLIINDGEFIGNGNEVIQSENSPAFIYGGSFKKVEKATYLIGGKNMTIYGGAFMAYEENPDGNPVRPDVVVKGGTFNYKHANIATGYAITDNGNGTWTVGVANNAGLDAAIKEGVAEITLGAGTFIIPDSASNKTLTIKGSGEDTVIASQDDGGNEGDCDYSFGGSTVTFENVTITTSTTYFPGYAGMKGIYNNCTINGVYTLYDDSVFNNCTFNVSGDVYSIWTWGASIATFNNCTFNSDGKAILLYSTVDTKLTVTGCTFNDNGGLTDLKAAIEIGNDYGRSYTLTVNNTVVNGYEINDKGINTGSTLWANKNSMGTDKLTVTVDGVKVYG